ncbi:MAG: hypothetical protein ABIK68_17295 [bacterium]
MEIIIAAAIAFILGRKRPLPAALIIIAVVMGLYFGFTIFEWRGFIVAAAKGVGLGFGFAYLVYFLASGGRGGSHNTGPSFGGVSRGGPGAGIMPTDEEEQNRKRKR